MPRIGDQALADLIAQEARGYLGSIDLIAASNAPSPLVRDQVSWSVGQFRSAEGYPGRRPYAGTGLFDLLEELASGRARSVFRAEHVNVQPLSGSMANVAAYRALLRRGDTVLAMSMAAGGHLSHSHPRHLVSEMFHVVTYGVSRETGRLEYDEVRAIALRARPRAIICGSSSYPRAIEFARLAQIAEEVGAVLIADISHIAGLVAAGVHPNPCDDRAVVTSSVEKTLRGTRGGLILCPDSVASAIDAAVFPGLQSSVGMAGLISLAAVLGEAATEAYRHYQRDVLRHACVLANALSGAGIALITGGTDTHLLVADVTSVGLTGRDAEARLEAIGILSNRNLIPFDTRPPFVASGLRLGSATITSRGFSKDEVAIVGGLVAETLLADPRDEMTFARLRGRVRDLALRDRANDTLADLVRSVGLDFEAPSSGDLGSPPPPQ